MIGGEFCSADGAYGSVVGMGEGGGEGYCGGDEGGATAEGGTTGDEGGATAAGDVSIGGGVSDAGGVSTTSSLVATGGDGGTVTMDVCVTWIVWGIAGCVVFIAADREVSSSSRPVVMGGEAGTVTVEVWVTWTVWGAGCVVSSVVRAGCVVFSGAGGGWTAAPFGAREIEWWAVMVVVRVTRVVLVRVVTTWVVCSCEDRGADAPVAR